MQFRRTKFCLVYENNEDGSITRVTKQDKQFAAWEQRQCDI